MTNQGRCLCGAIKFDVLASPVKVSHCHCTMCQQQHGAAFATYARFRRADIKYTCGEDKLTVYNSSDDVLRKFCATCGSNIEWGCAQRMPEWVAIALTSLKDQHVDGEIKALHKSSAAPWLSNITIDEDD